jgi:formate C-acetyltransferase
MNTNCENGHDINGITALFHSVSSLPLTKFPNGTCLDVTLHPSAVTGSKGIDTIFALITSFFDMGGNTIQFNIFNKDTLLEAQMNPEKYPNLQIRVCGWNVRFVDLAPEEQQIFIDRAGVEE